jgi:hypothetical protein
MNNYSKYRDREEKKQTKNKKSLKSVSILLSRHFTEQKQEAVFALYLKILTHYTSGVVLNATHKKIASLTKISRPSVKKYLSLGAESGLFYWEGKNLVCVSQKKLTKQLFPEYMVRGVDYSKWKETRELKKNGEKIAPFRYLDGAIHEDSTLKDIKLVIRLLLIETAIVAKEKGFKKGDGGKGGNRKKRKKKYVPDKFDFPYREVAAVISRSKTTGIRVIRELSKKRLIRRKKSKIVPFVEKPMPLKEVREKIQIMAFNGVFGTVIHVGHGLGILAVWEPTKLGIKNRFESRLVGM